MGWGQRECLHPSSDHSQDAASFGVVQCEVGAGIDGDDSGTYGLDVVLGVGLG